MYEIFAKLLEEKGLKAADVTRGTGIKSPVFSEWKKGKSKPNTEKMIKIANFLGVSVEYLMTGKESSKEKESELTARDERDIAKDLRNIMEKLENKEDGPASFEGNNIPDEDREMFAGQVEIMLRRLKAINKKLYNPNKNKK